MKGKELHSLKYTRYLNPKDWKSANIHEKISYESLRI